MTLFEKVDRSNIPKKFTMPMTEEDIKRFQENLKRRHNGFRKNPKSARFLSKSAEGNVTDIGELE